MNFPAIAELTVVLLVVLFVLRALIGVRQEYRMRDRRLHMQRAIGERRSVGAISDPLKQPIGTPRGKQDLRVSGMGLFQRAGVDHRHSPQDYPPTGVREAAVYPLKKLGTTEEEQRLASEAME